MRGVCGKEGREPGAQVTVSQAPAVPSRRSDRALGHALPRRLCGLHWRTHGAGHREQGRGHGDSEAARGPTSRSVSLSGRTRQWPSCAHRMERGPCSRLLTHGGSPRLCRTQGRRSPGPRAAGRAGPSDLGPGPLCWFSRPLSGPWCHCLLGGPLTGVAPAPGWGGVSRAVRPSALHCPGPRLPLPLLGIYAPACYKGFIHFVATPFVVRGCLILPVCSAPVGKRVFK